MSERESPALPALSGAGAAPTHHNYAIQASRLLCSAVKWRRMGMDGLAGGQSRPKKVREYECSEV
jgi:hypothetical protein